MINLPNEKDLIQDITLALKNIEKRYERLSNAGWFPEIASEIAKSISARDLKCYARGKRRGEPADGCKGNEWLFDFCAIIEDKAVKCDDRFMAQAAIVGEVEWGKNGIDADFEKLLIVDSLVCFMVFQQSSEKDARNALARLWQAVERRQEYARLRGMTRPPVFLLSCWVLPEHRFIHWPEDKKI